MKNIIILAATMLLATFMQAQTYTKTSNNTFKVEVSTGSTSGYEKTQYSVEYKGKTYAVYVHTITRGNRKGQVAYYIRRVSKNNREYWFELKNFAANIN